MPPQNPLTQNIIPQVPKTTPQAQLLPLLEDKKYIGMTGAEIFHETLKDLNVEKLFGYPGGAILPVFDAIHESEYFDFILPRHEQGGGHILLPLFDSFVLLS
eukprot:TRINITY_DN11375_c0_g1_i1.p1 TRINITY_DN11375_c0_g1~~TRINITY_DN11375_c0_g1_i1.p1  ORF type:complete len:102 (-),score=24.41 TRINITY_DN11375_c0_g1_i1:209-514(-)